MPVLINSETGFAENIDNKIAQQSLQQGTHEVPLISPEGVQGTAPMDAVSDLLKEGYKQPNSEQLKEMLDYAKYSTTGEQIKTGVEAAASLGTFGVSRLVEKSIFDNEEEQRKRLEINPKSAMAGEAVELGLGMMTGAGIATLMEKAGAKAAQGVTSKVGQAAIKGAVENAIFQASSEGGKYFINDPHQSAQTAITDIAMSGLLGAGVGAAIGGLGQAWKETGVKAANSALSHLDDISLGEASRLEKNVIFQNEVENLPSMFGKSIEDVQTLKDKSVYQAGNQIKDGIIKNINKLKSQAVKDFEDISAKFEKQMLSKADKADVANALGDRLLIEGYNKIPDASGAKLFQNTINHMPLQESVEDLRKYVSKLGEENAANPSTYVAYKSIRNTLNEAIDSIIERKVQVNAPTLLEQFKIAKAEYRQAANLVSEISDGLRIRVSDSMSTNLKRISELSGEEIFKKASIHGDVELQNLLAKNFPEVSDLVSKHELDNVLKASLDSAGEMIDYKKLQSNINKLNPELREKIIPKEVIGKLDEIKNIAEQLGTRTKGIHQAEKMLDEMSPANLALIAKMTDKSYMMTFAQSLFGQKFLGKNPEAVKLAIMKHLESGQQLNPKAFKSLIDYTNAIVKGEGKVVQAVGNVFNIGTKIAIKEKVNTDALKDRLADIEKNPEQLFNIANELSHYTPEHSSAIGETTGRVVQYLQTLKPNTAPLGPLNKPRVPSKTEEANYNRALEIAEQPTIVLNKIKDGTLTMDDINHLRNMYPSLYSNFQNKLNSELLNSVHNGTILPYKTKLALSMFNGQPLDASMQPMAIMSNQGQVMPQQQMPKATPSRADKLNKMPGSYMTPQQQRESSKSMGQ